MKQPHDAATRRHYEALAEAVDVPIVVQDFPASSGAFMPPNSIDHLATAVALVSLPLAGGDPMAQKVTNILEAKADVAVLGGLGRNFMLEESQRGVICMSRLIPPHSGVPRHPACGHQSGTAS